MYFTTNCEADKMLANIEILYQIFDCGILFKNPIYIWKDNVDINFSYFKEESNLDKALKLFADDEKYRWLLQYQFGCSITIYLKNSEDAAIFKLTKEQE